MASEHLRRMKHLGLLKNTREGRRMYVEVAEPELAGIMKCVESRFESLLLFSPDTNGTFS